MNDSVIYNVNLDEAWLKQTIMTRCANDKVCGKVSTVWIGFGGGNILKLFLETFNNLIFVWRVFVSL